MAVIKEVLQWNRFRRDSNERNVVALGQSLHNVYVFFPADSHSVIKTFPGIKKPGSTVLNTSGSAR
jgi:hypothetical protein